MGHHVVPLPPVDSLIFYRGGVPNTGMANYGVDTI